MHDPLPFRTAFVTHAMDYPCDLVQVHDLPALEAGVEIAANKGVPLVYDAHELYPEQKSFSRAQRHLCHSAESRMIRHAALVFAVNDSIAQEMATRYHIEKPIVLLNALDPPLDFCSTVKYDLLRQKLSLASSTRLLLFQGGFAPHRSLRKLVEAMSFVRSEDVRLVMLGFGDFGLELQRIAQKYQVLNRRVHFLPAVPQDVLLHHSASADLGIIPYPHVDLNSLYCTPNKLFEFIQAGLPILANDSPELKRFVQDQGFGIVKPLHNPRQIAFAIDDVFANGDIASWKDRLMAQNNRYTWKVEGRVYMDAMQPLLARV